MHSHSFAVTKFKLLRQVNDCMEQVVDGLTILWYPRELRDKGLITHRKRKFNMHSRSFQNTERKSRRYVEDYPEQVVEGLEILGLPVGWGYI